MHVRLGKTQCVDMLLSGTASGVMGAAFLARQAGIANALTLDIGGETEIRTFDAKTLKPSGRLRFTNEP